MNAEFERLMQKAEEDFQAQREITNANITHVSYVDKPAHGKKFFLTKSVENSEQVSKNSKLEEMRAILQEQLKPLTERLDAVEEKRAIQKAQEQFKKSELYQMNELSGMKAVHSSQVFKALLGEHDGADV